MSNEEQKTSICKLSVLIPTLTTRTYYLSMVLNNLQNQIGDLPVEIIIDSDNKERTTGAKRNNLIEKAKGEYIVFFDDDDIPGDNYIKRILEAIEHKPDVIPINGYMTTNGVIDSKVYWEMGLGFDYCKKYKDGLGMYYERFPNHIAPMRKELIKDFKFQDRTIGEDYEWAKRIHDAGVLKTEVRITENIYHYNFYNK